MKDFIIELIRKSENDLERMKKSEMSLSERVLHEKVLVRLEIAKEMLRKFSPIV